MRNQVLFGVFLIIFCSLATAQNVTWHDRRADNRCLLLSCGPNEICILGLLALCGCAPGYAGLLGLCTDRNECTEGIHNCNIGTGAFCVNTDGSFYCDCPSGYYVSNGVSCLDVNECGTGNACPGAHRTCTNTPGSYSCSCHSGFEELSPGLCSDINECEISNCTPNSICTNYDGGFNCTCSPGYESYGSLCQNINECSRSNLNKCHKNAKCDDTPGNYTCTCNTGYSGNGFNCENINECDTGNHNCDTNANCIDTVGSFNCVCKSGYSGNGLQCEDINECDNGICGSYSTCVNTPGSHNCGCLEGFELFFGSCIDKNECVNGENNCSTNGTCTNEIGGFTCECLPGYDGDGITCLDVDECVGVNACSADAICINSIGNYTCACKSGFSGDGFACADIDECEDVNRCGQNANCQNNVGSFECSCQLGYTGSPCIDINECISNTTCSGNETCINSPGSHTCTCLGEIIEYQCQDVNECLTGSDNCSSNAVCTNTISSFTCECNSGYEANGYNCEDINECEKLPSACGQNSRCVNTQGSYNCSCFSGFERIGQSNCTDINECTARTHNCHAKATCYNTIGNYSCSCISGFTGSGYVCTDVNECTAQTHTCGTNSVCTNNYGGYTCPCKSGFSKNGSACVDNNECLGNPCTGNFQCHNTIGSYNCTCPSGYGGDLCLDINECETLSQPCPSNHTCNNFPGLYNCSCSLGFIEQESYCIDINECSLGIDRCNTNATCLNTIGSYTCDCFDGFSGNGTFCEDIDECAPGNGAICGINSICTNQFPLFSCACKSGFAGNPCVDKNECLLGTHDCSANQTCWNNVGGFSCNCSTGFTNITGSCLDINECSVNRGGCHTNALCVNTLGSHTCSCMPGFTGTGYSCSDVDECLRVPCGTNGVCHNTPGSFECSCAAGYTGSPPMCTDFDECEWQPELCGKNKMCINIPGNYTCECKQGYEKSGTTCKDINECTTGVAKCGTNAKCYNTEGNFTCLCDVGFSGDGYFCQVAENCDFNPCGPHANCRLSSAGRIECTCADGYEGEPPNCIDIDECKRLLPCGLSTQACTNTEGGYSCDCPLGFEPLLGAIDLICQDINECPDACTDNNSVCINTIGSYRCLCNLGYHKNNSVCEDDNECEVVNCGLHAECTNTPGSFECGCKAGYVGLPPLCLDYNECLFGGHNCSSNQTCINMDGGFTCECKNGFSAVDESCIILNECQVSADCPTNSSCTNHIIGSKSCTCNYGYSGIPPNCKEIPVCESDISCPANQTCSGTLLGLPICDCRSGWGIYPLCFDPDACHTDADCGAYGSCSNSYKGFNTCECKNGGIYPLCNIVYPLLQLLIDGPGTISPCSPFSLVASVLGRLTAIFVKSVQWTLEGNSSEIVQFNSALISNPSSSTFVLSISNAADISLLQENKEYNLVATIVDSLDRVFYSVHHFSRLNFPAPLVTINGPSILAIYADTPLDLSAALQPSTCAPSVPIAWSWYFNNNIVSSTPTLHRAAGTIPFGTHTISLLAGYTGYSRVNTSIQVTVLRSSLIAKLSNAANMTHLVDRALVLDASESYDPDLATLNYRWSCLNPGLATATCIDASGRPMTITNASRINIPANSLRTSSPYVFTVHVTSLDGRTSTASTRISIQPPGTTSISITTAFNYRTSTLRLSAATTSSELTYQWVSSNFALSTSHALLSTSTTMPILALSYSALSGGSYTFTVVGTNYVGQTTSASTSIVIPQAPTGGSCVCNPPRGNALTTRFTLACPDWQYANSVAETSLRFAFAYVLDGVEVSLGSARYASSLQTYLPPSSSSQLQLVARVIGPAPFAMYTSYNFSVTVDLPVEQDAISLLDQKLTHAVDQYDTTGDRQAFFQDLVTVSSFAAIQHTTAANAFHNRVIPLFISSSVPGPDNSLHAVAQETAAFYVLIRNLPPSSSILSREISMYLDNTVNNYKDLLVGSPVEDLIKSVSSLIDIAQGSENRRRNIQDDTEVHSVMRRTLSNLVKISVSTSSCGQVPVSIATKNIQMTVANVYFKDALSIAGTDGGASMLVPADVFSSQTSIPECIRTEVIAQNPAIYNLNQNTTNQTPNGTRPISSVLGFTLGKTLENRDEFQIIDLPTPIKLAIPISSVECNTTLYNCTVECKYYNNTIGDWDTKGCVITNVTDTYVICECNHLTDFVASFTVGLKSLDNTGNVIGDIVDIFNEFDRPWIIIQVGGLWLIFLIAVFFARRRDILLERKSLATSPSKIKLLSKKRSIKKKFWERVKADHRWLCIFYREAESQFSTARRVSVVFLVLMTSMAANCIFYEQRIYEFSSIWEKILTAVWSALIIVPINFIVIFIIRRSSSIRQNSNKSKRKEITTRPYSTGLSPPSSPYNGRSLPSTFPSSPSLNMLDISNSDFPSTPKFSSEDSSSDFEMQRVASSAAFNVTFISDDQPPQNQNQRRPGWIRRFLEWNLPWYMEIIGYALWVGLVGFSTVLVLLYGLSFDEITLKSWFISSWISIGQDALFSQPFFNFVSAIVDMSITGKLNCAAFFDKCY